MKTEMSKVAPSLKITVGGSDVKLAPNSVLNSRAG